MQNSHDKGKIAAAYAAAEVVHNGMLVGLGTGSTAYFFINKLIEKCAEGLKIRVVASSLASLEQAKKGNIPIANMDEVTDIDLTVDGADEIDPQFRMIKGGGGALLREKIVASSSKKMIVIIDETKWVSSLGKAKLPVEIIPFGYQATIAKLNKLGHKGTLRTQKNDTHYITDNGNYIYDIHFPKLLNHPEKEEEKISSIPGVVDTGFFFNLATEVIIGYNSGEIKKIVKKEF